jgi:Zn finger protein HypA/HybF involved in hydrogenase expression
MSMLKFKLKAKRCPECGSRDTRINWAHPKNIVGGLIMFLLPESLVLGGPEMQMYCDHCKAKFNG